MVYDEAAVELVRDALILMLKVSTPILLAGVVIGLIISVVQSVTSIQEQTLTFVPKIVGMVLVAVLLMHWIVQWVIGFAADMFSFT